MNVSLTQWTSGMNVLHLGMSMLFTLERLL